MGAVFKKTYTKPVPAGAEPFTRKGERFARWKDRRGKTRTAALTVGADGAERIILESPRYFAKYRDGAGVVRVVPTGCRDETAARQVLADLEREAELVRSGVKTAAESAVGRHQARALAEHFDTYLTSLESAGACSQHRTERRRQLHRIARECRFSTLADLKREPFERWLAAQVRAGMSARMRNIYRAALLAFCNWCVNPTVGRLANNPFRGIPQANEKADPRRQRRSMTEDELTRLLAVARERPLLEALTIRRGKRKGEHAARVRPETRAQRALLGRERALIYKTLVLSGLRKGELRSLTVGQLHLDEPVPFVALDAADEKNRQGNDVPLRDDLANDLRQWLSDKLSRLQSEARGRGEPIPSTLPPDTPLFRMPRDMTKGLDRDLKLAGIPKRDERGRTLDVHALRHTFGTLLSKGGVAPRTAQAAMRHSKIDLTMNVYTDPRLLDVAGALDALPALPLDGERTEQEAIRATGTDGGTARTLAPTLAPTADKQSESLSIAGNLYREAGSGVLAVSGVADKRKDSLAIPVSECPEPGRVALSASQAGLFSSVVHRL